MAVQLSVEGVGGYSVGKVRGGGGLPEGGQGLREGTRLPVRWTVLNKETDDQSLQ